ncbi:hypothetical protein D3C77_395070 [compost metagenome]
MDDAAGGRDSLLQQYPVEPYAKVAGSHQIIFIDAYRPRPQSWSVMGEAAEQVGAHERVELGLQQGWRMISADIQ